MNYPMRSILQFSLLALSAYGFSEVPVAPQTEKVEPRVGKPGTIINIWGKALDASHVEEVFLTDHRFDMKVKVLEQSANHLAIRIPPFVKPGRLQLLLLTAGNNPAYLEQPWFVLIEAGDDDTPAPVLVSRKSKPTVEVAATGTSIPVPVAGAAPSLATSAVEKSVVPLKAQPVAPKPVEMASSPTLAPVTAAPVPTAAAASAVAGQVQRLVSNESTPPVRASAPIPPAAPPAPALAGAPNPANIPAQVVRRTPVNYPAGAAAQRIEGAVELVAVVRADGRVKEVKVLRGNPLLVGAAIISVKDWLYEPAYMQGKPVESEVSVILNFRRPQ